MMYTVNVTKYCCPCCGKKYDVTKSSFFFLGNRDHKFTYYLNTPVIKCKSCGFEFLDNRFNEIINYKDTDLYFMDYNTMWQKILCIINLIIATGFLITLFFSIEYYGPFLAFLFFALFFGLIWRFKFLKYKRHVFDRKVVSSLKRCNDLIYLKKLESFNLEIFPIGTFDINNNRKHRDLIESLNSKILQLKNEKLIKEKETNIALNKLFGIFNEEKMIDNIKNKLQPSASNLFVEIIFKYLDTLNPEKILANKEQVSIFVTKISEEIFKRYTFKIPTVDQYRNMTFLFIKTTDVENKYFKRGVVFILPKEKDKYEASKIFVSLLSDDQNRLSMYCADYFLSENSYKLVGYFNNKKYYYDSYVNNLDSFLASISATIDTSFF